jgi:UDP-glucuronate decarboxylase
VLVNGHPGEAYNIGVETPEIVTKFDAAYLVDNPDRRCPIVNKAREQIGYSPTILVDEGLRRSLVWYSANREAEEA